MQVSAVAAALGAAGALWLLLPPRASSSASLGLPRPRATGPGLRLGPALGLAVLAGGLVALLDGTALALGLIAASALAGGWRMVVRGRSLKGAHQRSDIVLEVCEALAAELRAGQPPLRALRHCVEVWPELEPVAAAAELGSDVPAALRRLAELPGCSTLQDLASAWQVSQSSGSTLALAVSRAADSARARRATQRLVVSELASAQATARLVGLLPVLVLAMGSGLGGDPWGFLLATPAGLTCLGSGLLLAYAGLAWIEGIAAGVIDP